MMGSVANMEVECPAQALEEICVASAMIRDRALLAG